MHSKLLRHAAALPAGFGLIAGTLGAAAAPALAASFSVTISASTTPVNVRTTSAGHDHVTVTPGNDDDRWTKAGVGVSAGAWRTSGGVQDSIFSNVGLPVRGW